MLCYFFCTQEIFGSVAPDVQRGVQVSGGIRDTRFYGNPTDGNWYGNECVSTGCLFLI